MPKPALHYHETCETCDAQAREIEGLRAALTDALDIVQQQAPDLYEAMDDSRAAANRPKETP